MSTTEELIRRLDAQHTEIKDLHQKSSQATDRKLGEVTSRLTEVEQTLAQRRPTGGGYTGKTLGSMVIEAADFKEYTRRGCSGSVRIPIDLKTVTLQPGSAGALAVPDYQPDPVLIPRTRLTVRQLLAGGQTTSNLVKFTKQTGRTNAAAVVTEGGLKPESNITFDLEDAPVRTIATWVPVSRQAIDDAPVLQSVIDSELRYMIGLTEEEQILFGDGTGENILGLSAQVAAYNAPFTVSNPTNLDTVLLAIAQAQLSKIAATGVILNDIDWLKMQSTKDSQGRYILGGPGAASIGSTLWSLPVVATPAMSASEFMVGAFAIGAQVVDRMQTEVLISSEGSDNFRKNLYTVRAEERVALLVKIPEAIVFGDFDTATH
jgi:HK97 family phage major capsid protein